MLITLIDYWMGRDVSHAAELTPEMEANATTLVWKVNRVLLRAAADGVEAEGVASGWRPSGINSTTANAAKGSNHLICRAVDLRDRSRRLASWSLGNLNELAAAGLWMEDPCWTPTWVHWQDRPPRSGKRVYIPSSAPPASLPPPRWQGRAGPG